MGNIIKTAKSSGNYKVFLKAIKKAGLNNILEGVGPFTVFMPSDEAFYRLPKGTFDNIMKNKDQLNQVLNFHIVSGKMDASYVKEGKITWAKSLEGSKIHLECKDDIMVEDAHLVKANIECDNGIIHEIDEVIMPGCED